MMAVALTAGLVGGFVRGYSGFGFALAAVPILTVAFPPVAAVPAVLPLELLLAVTTIPSQRVHVQWTTVRWLALGALIGTPVGVAVLTFMPADLMRLIIGLFVFLAVVLLWHVPALPGMLRPLPLWGAGFASGLFGGGTAMSGPPVILALLGSGQQVVVARANLMVFIAISAAWAMAVAAASRLYRADTLATVLILVPAVLAGGWAGLTIFERTSKLHYRGVSFVILIGVTIVAVSTAAWNLLAKAFS